MVYTHLTPSHTYTHTHTHTPSAFFKLLCCGSVNIDAYSDTNSTKRGRYTEAVRQCRPDFVSTRPSDTVFFLIKTLQGAYFSRY